jgi:hypothetical protein
MEQIGYIQNISEILQFLAPGFLATFLFYLLASLPKKSEFEMIIMALIYTVFINMFTHILKEFLSWQPIDFGIWDNTSQNIWTFVIAFILGLFVAWVYKKRFINMISQKLFGGNIYPDVWYSAFCSLSKEESYIILYFVDDSYPVRGIPREYPSSSKEGHFLLGNVAYLIDGLTPEPFPKDYQLLINVKDVKNVVFLREGKEVKNES